MISTPEEFQEIRVPKPTQMTSKTCIAKIVTGEHVCQAVREIASKIRNNAEKQGLEMTIHNILIGELLLDELNCSRF